MQKIRKQFPRSKFRVVAHDLTPIDYSNMTDQHSVSNLGAKVAMKTNCQVLTHSTNTWTVSLRSGNRRWPPSSSYLHTAQANWTTLYLRWSYSLLYSYELIWWAGICCASFCDFTSRGKLMRSLNTTSLAVVKFSLLLVARIVLVKLRYCVGSAIWIFDRKIYVFAWWSCLDHRQLANKTFIFS